MQSWLEVYFEQKLVLDGLLLSSTRANWLAKFDLFFENPIKDINAKKRQWKIMLTGEKMFVGDITAVNDTFTKKIFFKQPQVTDRYNINTWIVKLQDFILGPQLCPTFQPMELET